MATINISEFRTYGRSDLQRSGTAALGTTDCGTTDCGTTDSGSTEFNTRLAEPLGTNSSRGLCSRY